MNQLQPFEAVHRISLASSSLHTVHGSCCSFGLRFPTHHGSLRSPSHPELRSNTDFVLKPLLPIHPPTSCISLHPGPACSLASSVCPSLPSLRGVRTTLFAKTDQHPGSSKAPRRRASCLPSLTSCLPTAGLGEGRWEGGKNADSRVRESGSVSASAASQLCGHL